MMLNLPIMIYRNIMYHKTILGIKLRNYVYDGQTIAMPIERKQHELQDTDALIISQVETDPRTSRGQALQRWPQLTHAHSNTY